MSHFDEFDQFTARDWEIESPSETVRFALLGLGWWTCEQAIPAIEKSKYCETTVVVSGSKEKAENVADDHTTIRRGLTYNEYHAGAAADDYDALYVVTPNATHLEYIRTAAKLGKDVLCEKPMEVSTERAREMVSVCAADDVELMIAYRMQTEPAVRRVREFVENGAIGDPVFAHSSMSATLLDIVPDDDQWRLDPELSGGCALVDLGIYPINTLRFILGTDPVRVSGSTASDHDAFDKVDEHATFRLEFPSMTATCTVSHGAYETSHLRLLGTDGEIRIDPIFHPWERRRVYVDRPSGSVRRSYDQVDQMREEFDYFAYCLLTETAPGPDGEHGLRDIAIVEAIYESAASGAMIDIPE